MISKNQLKAISKILPKKAFNPVLQNLIYYKDYNTFIVTDAFLLYEFENPFDKFDFDFSISGSDITKIKEDIKLITINGEIATITTKKNDILCKIFTDLTQPSYKSVLENKEKTTLENIYCIDNTYKKLFGLLPILGIDYIEPRSDIFYGENSNIYGYKQTIVCRIQKDFSK